MSFSFFFGNIFFIGRVFTVREVLRMYLRWSLCTLFLLTRMRAMSLLPLVITQVFVLLSSCDVSRTPVNSF